MPAFNIVDRREHDLLRHLISHWREAAGLSQRELSARLGRPHNFIVKIESGVRGVGVVDLVDILRTLNKPVASGFQEYCNSLEEQSSRERT